VLTAVVLTGLTATVFGAGPATAPSPPGSPAGCATDLRDAALAGWMDFLSGSVTEGLGTILPVDEIIEALVG